MSIQQVEQHTSAAKVSFLVINVSRIGDTLFSTPAMRALATAYPGCRITALGHPRRAEVFLGLSFLHRVGTITKRTAPWRGRLDGTRYTYALVYGFDEPLVAYALRVADRVVAFRQSSAEINARLYRCVEPPVIKSEHSVLQHLRLPAALGIPPAGFRLAYQVAADEAREARQRLTNDVPTNASPLVGLQIASFPTKSYRDWPPEHFVDLAERIVSEWPRAHFLLFGGTAERERVRWLADRLSHRATVYAGRLTLRETAALMSLTDMYVGVDTGPTHIMSTFDIPMVGLYHCLSSSALMGPLDHPCSYPADHPCPVEQCSVETDMRELSVDMVFAKIMRALNEHPPQPLAGRRS